MKDVLFNLIKKQHLNISIYTEEIFERRCQEEIIRSDEEQSSFVYLEFSFEGIKAELPDEEEHLQFWELFMAALSKNRGSDIMGFLEHQSGIGILLLDSKLNGWTRVKGRLEQLASEHGMQKMKSLLEKTVNPIVYPTCIQDTEETK